MVDWLTKYADISARQKCLSLEIDYPSRCKVNTNFNNHAFTGWHFPRLLLAESYLRTLSSGVMLSTSVYAPPQTGLSNFFINDVITSATDSKYATVYVDLSDPRIPPTAAMLLGLERLLMGTSIFRSGFNFFKGFFQAKEISACQKDKYISNPEIIDNEYFKNNLSNHFNLIESHIQKIAEYKSVLILIDHVENINKHEIGFEFIHFYKKLIEKYSYCVKPLYGSNNMEGWRDIFQNRASPLNSEGAFVHKLPPLGKAFVRVVMLRSGQIFNIEEAIYCYEMTGERPGVFMALLTSWASHLGISMHQHFCDGLASKESVLLPEEVYKSKITS